MVVAENYFSLSETVLEIFTGELKLPGCPREGRKVCCPGNGDCAGEVGSAGGKARRARQGWGQEGAQLLTAGLKAVERRTWAS